jgi:hypothetical protein
MVNFSKDDLSSQLFSSDLLTYSLTYLLTYLLTYILTPWSRVHLEKLTSKYIDQDREYCGSDSVAGIVTGYGLEGPGIESPVEARFSAPVQTGPGAHPASCTMGTGSFPGVKSGRGVTLNPHPLLVSWP